jgi:hypothetical protein
LLLIQENALFVANFTFVVYFPFLKNVKRGVRCHLAVLLPAERFSLKLTVNIMTLKNAQEMLQADKNTCIDGTDI